MIARLVNLAPDGSDATAEGEGGLYGNGIAVKFNSDADGEATIVLKLICPDHINGAFNYRIYHSINGADFVKEALDGVQNHEFFDYTIKVNVKKGENTIKFVQGVDPWGNGNESGNGWRVDIAKLSITLPEASADTPADPGTTDEPANPASADASVIAIAAVACVALAGAVIAKKVK